MSDEGSSAEAACCPTARDAETTPGQITGLLRSWADGDPHAFNTLFPVAYQELRRLADRYLSGEREGHTLTPTALVNEAYLRLMRANPQTVRIENRRHFFAFAAQAMRRILVEHARHHAAARRPSPRQALPFEEGSAFDRLPETASFEVLAVHQALKKLEADHPRQAQIVELRYFGGLNEDDVSAVLGVSRSTVAREWRVARILLRRLLELDLASGEGG